MEPWSISYNQSLPSRQRAMEEASSLTMIMMSPLFLYQRASIKLWADILDGWIKTCEQSTVMMLSFTNKR